MATSFGGNVVRNRWCTPRFGSYLKWRRTGQKSLTLFYLSWPSTFAVSNRKDIFNLLQTRARSEPSEATKIVPYITIAQTPTMMLPLPSTNQHRLRSLIVVSVSALISIRTAAAFTSVSSRQCVISRYQPSSRKYVAEHPSSKSKTSTLSLSASLIDDAKLLIENSMWVNCYILIKKSCICSTADDFVFSYHKSYPLLQRRNTDRGRSVNPHELTQINTHISSLESLCPLSDPARDLQMGGMWEVL